MGDYYQTCTLPKPTPRRIVKARKDRAEAAVKRRVRERCVERDGDCRLSGASWHTCVGESQWAHLGEHKRARTRGMAPGVRHTTAGSLMLCTQAHAAYDQGRLVIRLSGPAGADGALAFGDEQHFYLEAEVAS